MIWVTGLGSVRDADGPDPRVEVVDTGEELREAGDWKGKD